MASDAAIGRRSCPSGGKPIPRAVPIVMTAACATPACARRRRPIVQELHGERMPDALTETISKPVLHV